MMRMLLAATVALLAFTLAGCESSRGDEALACRSDSSDRAELLGSAEPVYLALRTGGYCNELEAALEGLEQDFSSQRERILSCRIHGRLPASMQESGFDALVSAHAVYASVLHAAREMTDDGCVIEEDARFLESLLDHAQAVLGEVSWQGE